MIFQFLGGDGDWTSTIIWLVLFVFFIFFGPRLMVAQSVLKLEKSVLELEQLAQKSRKHIIRTIKGGQKKKSSINSFMEFFAVPPISLDPYGVIKKLDHVMKNSENRFKYFVNQISPESSEVNKANLKGALAGAITTHQIAKIVRHYLMLVKKYKMVQLAMVILMQIPLVERVAKAAEKATKAFVDGVPIGDGIGPLVAANLMKGKTKTYKEEEMVVCKTKIGKKNIFVAKALGPGANTGHPGKFLQKFIKKNNIKRIITVDAAMRLEGEKPGTVAEGVGVAMGGVGVERYEIEAIAVKRKMPLDAVGIKVSDEEALGPMKKEIFDSVPEAIDYVKESLKRANKDKVLIIGVGNTCGVGNNYKDVEKAEALIRKGIRKIKEQEKKKGFRKKKSL